MSKLEASSLSWAPLVLTREKLALLWEKFQAFSQPWDDLSNRTLEHFYNTLANPANHFYEVTDSGTLVGLAAAMAVRPGLDAVVHLMMFDRRLRGREPVFVAILDDFARRAHLRRFTAMLPEDNPMAQKLALRLGFRKEGVMRQAFLRGGKYMDLVLYGMLREELGHSIMEAGRSNAPAEALEASDNGDVSTGP